MDLKSLSELIKKEREKRGIDYEKIFKDLKIVSKFIEYMENGEWDKFPADFYKKAILKKYLDYLEIEGIDVEEVFKGKKEEEFNEEKVINNIEERKEKIESNFNIDRKFYIAIFLLFLLIILLFIINLTLKNLSK